MSESSAVKRGFASGVVDGCHRAVMGVRCIREWRCVMATRRDYTRTHNVYTNIYIYIVKIYICIYSEYIYIGRWIRPGLVDRRVVVVRKRSTHNVRLGGVTVGGAFVGGERRGRVQTK
jgi:hypothetical protein